jgi:uncharacterized protein YjbJ (UPF0337 family)
VFSTFYDEVGHDAHRCIKMEIAMNWDRVKGNWKEMSGQAKQHWGKLTHDDLTTIKGRREELEGAIQKRYGYEKEEAKTEIDNWLDEMEEM